MQEGARVDHDRVPEHTEKSLGSSPASTGRPIVFGLTLWRFPVGLDASTHDAVLDLREKAAPDANREGGQSGSDDVETMCDAVPRPPEHPRQV